MTGLQWHSHHHDNINDIQSSHSSPRLDSSLLYGLGIKFVLVPGKHVQVDKLLAEKGREPKYVGRYRITDPDSLKAAMDLAGRIRLMIEAKLSPGPSLCGIRRHKEKKAVAFQCQCCKW
ncbi:putative amino-acid N-acetyltransferase [Helianthus annuus]|uniref:Amino-acid N-acetyltransferase n=2 Tax=Helianthus annuus TaxID=4232 RepID=A0A9K3JKZ4_HELAN|nr:putative amino-acid N-acetyltransferase [Helianthus annuus]KAJ0776498.1 putative amino-acid N-acetyltransferase [Helianthus annuus]KAJ0938999.1 putative amino-acid N-acetyltransferase [Helianthus annuus]